VTRDSTSLLVAFVTAASIFLGSHFDLLHKAFPLITEVWQARLELIAAIGGFVTGYLRMSPLPLSPDHPLGSAMSNQQLTFWGRPK